MKPIARLPVLDRFDNWTGCPDTGIGIMPAVSRTIAGFT